MQQRLSDIINYATNGKQAEFARIMGWKPQYLNNMLKGQSMALQPVLAVLTAFPEINARWFLLGQGSMLGSTDSTSVHAQLQKLTYEVQELRETVGVKHQKIAKNLQNIADLFVTK